MTTDQSNLHTSASHSSLDEVNARYGVDAIQALPDFNPTLSLLLRHHSVRSYLPDALKPGTLELLIAAGQSAPSSSNLQVWSVIAVEDSARKSRLATLAGNQRHIEEAPLLLLFLADLARVRALSQQRGIPAEGIDYLDTYLMAVIDATLAAQNVVTAAESLGLGSVYIGALRNKPEQVSAEVGLPPGVFPVFGLVLGYPDPAKPGAVKPRLSQSAVLHRERYQLAHQLDEVARYDTIMNQFYADQQLPQTEWTTHSLNRLRDAAALRGRDRLAEAIANQGIIIR